MDRHYRHNERRHRLATWETYKHDLSDFKGKKNVVIALHYACAASSGTWEVKNLSVKEATGGTPDTPSKPDTPATKDGITIDGTTVTLSNAAATTTGASVELDLNAAGLVNQAAVETVKFSDGSTVTFDANGQENGPKFYTNTKGVRVYANNKLIFKGIKKIKQIVMTCDSYNGTNTWQCHSHHRVLRHHSHLHQPLYRDNRRRCSASREDHQDSLCGVKR